VDNKSQGFLEDFLSAYGLDTDSAKIIAGSVDIVAATAMIYSMTSSMQMRLFDLMRQLSSRGVEVFALNEQITETQSKVDDLTAQVNQGIEHSESLTVENQDLHEELSKAKERIDALERDLKSVSLTMSDSISGKELASKDAKYLTNYFADFFAMVLSDKRSYGVIRDMINSKGHEAAFNTFIRSLPIDGTGAVRVLVNTLGITGDVASQIVKVCIENESYKEVKLMGRKKGQVL
jgi:regulator of replication initiation timing